MFEECPMCGNPNLSTIDTGIWESVRCKKCGWESFDDGEYNNDYEEDDE